MKKHNNKKIIAIVVSLILILIVIFAVIKILTKNTPKEEVPKTKVEEEIKNYGYVLLDNETELYKQTFKELIETLNKEEINEESYASLVVKLFILDFYDLNSKTTKNDIGGIQFIYDKVTDNFILNSKDTIYKYVENNLNDDRTQKLPSLKEVTINNVDKTSFTYKQENIADENAYMIKATWEYQEDLGYQKEASFTLMHIDNKLVIVEIK